MTTSVKVDERNNDDKGKFFTYFVDDKEFHTEKSQLTAAEILDNAQIPRSDGLVQILEDGTQVPLTVDTIITFEGPGRRFKKAPRFKRG